MAITVLNNVRLFTGAADLTSVSNKVALDAELEEKDVTTFLDAADADSGWKKVTGGLLSASATAEGFWEAGSAAKVDDTSWSDLGGLSAWSVLPVASSVSSLAYLMKAMRGKYQRLGQVGDIAPWQAEMKSAWPLVRGVVAHPPGTARTSSGTGTAIQLGAISASQGLYAALHVLSVSGTSTPTVTVIVESNADNTFGSPTTQLSFTGATAIGGQISRSLGAVTDQWFRVKWTISGSSPSFLFLATFGVI